MAELGFKRATGLRNPGGPFVPRSGRSDIQRICRRDCRQAQRRANRRVGQLAGVGIQAREQVIKQAMYTLLNDVVEVERLFLIVKAQKEY